MATKLRVLKTLFFVALSLLLSQCSDEKPRDYVQEGIDLTNQQNYDGAMQSFSKAIEINPKNAQAHYGLGGIYNYLKDYDKAQKAFETVIRLDPTHYNGYYSLGYTLEMMGRKEEAEKNFARSRKLKKQLDDIINKNSEPH